MNTVRTALVGCGKVGGIHARALANLSESEFVAVCDSDRSRAEAFAAAEGIRGEYVVQVSGQVGHRPPGQENTTLPTGEIEVLAERVVVLNTAKPTPFPVDRDDAVDETVRLRYRYLDLRRERMQRNLILRHNAVKLRCGAE